MVGATGNIGKPTLSELQKTGIHTITAVTRNESNATFPESVSVKKGDYTDESFLVSSLKDQDVLILQVGHSAYEQQVPLIQAAAKAGVKYVLPTEFGSDIESAMTTAFPMLIGAKKKYRDLIESLGMSWIAVVNNPWFDWSLKQKAWGIDIPSRKATIYKGAQAKFNTSTLSQTAKGVAALLSLPENELKKYKNRPVYISSFQTTQREILESAIRATGTKESDWDVEEVEADKAIEESKKEVAAGNWMAMIKEFYITHMIEGKGGNFQAKAEKDAAVLGMKEENFDDVIKTCV